MNLAQFVQVFGLAVLSTLLLGWMAVALGPRAWRALSRHLPPRYLKRVGVRLRAPGGPDA